MPGVLDAVQELGVKKGGVMVENQRLPSFSRFLRRLVVVASLLARRLHGGPSPAALPYFYILVVEVSEGPRLLGC